MIVDTTGLAACDTVDVTGAAAAATGAATFVTVDTAGLTVAATGAAAFVAADGTGVPVAGCVAALVPGASACVAVLVTAFGTDDTVDVTPEVTDESPDTSGWCSDVAAWACRENTSMRKKKPAAAIANCTARRAIRRETGRGISSSHTQRTRSRAITRELLLQTAPAGHIPHDRPGLDALYVHHRTAPSVRAARDPIGNLATELEVALSLW